MKLISDNFFYEFVHIHSSLPSKVNRMFRKHLSGTKNETRLNYDATESIEKKVILTDTLSFMAREKTLLHVDIKRNTYKDNIYYTIFSRVPN